jgi:hypothetical protein
LIIKPGWVDTKLAFRLKKGNKSSLITTTVEEESQSILKSIGFTQETYGHTKHLMMMIVLGMIPYSLYNPAMAFIKRKKVSE